ncbi:MAG: LssY C-terminal domain-containing protein [Candidatus Korobacteraceae bacterium]|jgi:LssY-like putative type I secretion system component LssY
MLHPKSRWLSLLLTFYLLLGIPVLELPAAGAASPQQATKSGKAAQAQAPAQTQEQAGEEEQPQNASEAAEQGEEEELAPAAVTFDVSKDSPLIQALYQATRETKEQAILEQIAKAQALVDSGADLKATDPQGRTALHWAVFGSSYTTKPKVLVAYEKLADGMIQRGVELNREDHYQDTALDYLLYSPNFEMQTLLIENGATSGFLTAFGHFFDQVSAGFPKTQAARIATTRTADLTPGMTFRIQLQSPVYSDRSRTGDPITAWVVQPVYNGKQLLIAPGTIIDGTVLFAQKAPNKYDRPRMVLDFSNVPHKEGTRSPLYLRVLDVENARETVRNNEIIGIVQPHASTKVSLITAAAAASNPIAGYAIKGAQTIYGLSIRREICFPEGTDIIVQVVRPSMMKEKSKWTGWPKLPVTPELQKIVHNAPLRTQTSKQVPSDLTNVIFLGTEKQLFTAFDEAGWYQAESLGVGSGLKSVQATIRKTGYNSAPVSLLTLNGAPPDYVFQKGLDTFAKRHHIRIWKLAETYNGQEVWIGAATHDIDIANSKKGTKWSHRIDPHVDRERDVIEVDLLYNEMAKGYAYVGRPDAPKKTSNGSGDEMLTDGEILVLQLGQPKTPNRETLPAVSASGN